MASTAAANHDEDDETGSNEVTQVIVNDTLTANCIIEDFYFYRHIASSSSSSNNDDDMMHIKIYNATTTTGSNLITDNNDQDLTGIMIWPATYLLCQYIAFDDRRTFCKDGGTVLELGCGVGMVGCVGSIAASRYRRRHRQQQQQQWNDNNNTTWISTDRDPNALQMCHRNMNSLVSNDNDDNTTTMQVKRLEWGNQEDIQSIHQNNNEKFHTIVGSDIIYPSTSDDVLSALFDTVNQLLSTDKESIFWLSYASRGDGTTTSMKLIQAATNAGYAIYGTQPFLTLDEMKKLPPLLDAKILQLKRHPNAELHNTTTLGLDDDCLAFPGLKKNGKKSLAGDDDDASSSSSDEEWVAPYMDDESLG